jgi:dihydrofolate reductase
MNPRLALVVAVAENGVIGAKGGLPWRVKADLKRFRAVTMGKPMIMGRRTFDSIGRVLDGRDSIIVTRRKTALSGEGVFAADSFGEALAIAKERAAARSAEEICVIGGGEIFALALPFADRLYVTEISGSPGGDVFFPPIAPTEWQETAREALPFSDGDSAAANHVVYERRR